MVDGKRAPRFLEFLKNGSIDETGASRRKEKKICVQEKIRDPTASNA
jgi:hypothetical protein